MSVTTADLNAAREGIHKVAAPGIMDKLLYGKEGGQQLQDMSTVSYWEKDMATQFGNKQPTQEEREAYFKDRSEKFIAAEIERIRKGGTTTKTELTTGTMGLGMGALIGAAFGGAKGAAIGGLLGGLAMWAMEKFGLTPDFAKGFIRDTSKAIPGLNPSEPAFQESLKKATDMQPTIAPSEIMGQELEQEAKANVPVEDIAANEWDDAVASGAPDIVPPTRIKAEDTAIGGKNNPLVVRARKNIEDAKSSANKGPTTPTPYGKEVSKIMATPMVSPDAAPTYPSQDPVDYTKGAWPTTPADTMGATPSKLAAAKATQDAAQAAADERNKVKPLDSGQVDKDEDL